MSFSVSEMSFTVLEMSFPILAEMSFGQNAQKKSLHMYFFSCNESKGEVEPREDVGCNDPSKAARLSTSSFGSRTIDSFGELLKKTQSANNTSSAKKTVHHHHRPSSPDVARNKVALLVVTFELVGRLKRSICFPPLSS